MRKIFELRKTKRLRNSVQFLFEISMKLKENEEKKLGRKEE